MRHRLRLARDSFWFLPTVLGIGALVLAELVVSLDRYLAGAAFGPLDAVLVRVGASGSRDILGAIGGSMLGVAATSFSITISVLATTSSTYGPRLVRNFMADRGNQLMLGIFGSTFLYSLVVLRSIRTPEGGDGEAFVPDLAVNLAVLLAVLDVAVLVYFIHHIADSVQVSTLAGRVGRELADTGDRLYPEQPRPGSTADPVRPAGTPVLVHPTRAGYVQEVDEDALLDWASEHDAVVEVLAGAGAHVLTTEAVARVWVSGETDLAAASGCVAVDSARTPRQDVRFAVQQLVEMAVRALSPSTNDPYTATNALHELAVGLVPLVGRPAPATGHCDDTGALRLVVVRVPLTELVADVFTAVRTHGTDHADVVRCALGLARRLERARPTAAVRQGLAHQLVLLDAALAGSALQVHDQDALRAELARELGALAPA